MKKKAFILIGIIVSASFLYLSIRKIDFSQVGNAFSSADYIWGIPTAVLIMFTMWLRALRWRHLLFKLKPIENKSLFSSVMIGFMSNNILPGRLGEFVRAFSIAGKESVPKTAAFATIIIERVFDSFAILLMLGICLILFPFPGAVKKVGYLTLAANIIVLLILYSLSKWPEKTTNIAAAITRKFPRKIDVFVMNLFNRFREGLGVFKDGATVWKVSFYTAIIWFITAVSNYFIFIALGIYPPFISVFVVLVIVAFVVMLPASPGFIGTFQYGCTVALSLFGIPKEISFPFSIILWSCQYFPVTAIGLYYLRKESFSLKAFSAEKM
ncbi:MAG: flippase-like domain-containing protein [candidate division Zixibacteria bacterium]|nr:flippase-like domain-containing protein [candidate division Zixibacteria bacterium]